MNRPTPPRPAPNARLERRLLAGRETAPRWYLLYGECVRRLADHPLTDPDRGGEPLAHGLGLEELVERIQPVFQREAALLGWTASRAALPHLDAHVLDPDEATAPRGALDEAMALDWIGDGEDVAVLALAEPWRSTLPDEQRNAAVGLAAVVIGRAEISAPGAHMLRRPEGEEEGRIVGAALALDTIAWCTTALLRLGGLGDVIDLPSPAPLGEPGWYPEPLWGGAERYWDGSDWTIWCRIHDGRHLRRVAVAMD